MFNSKDMYHQLKSEMTTNEAIEEYKKDCLATVSFIIKTLYIFTAIFSVFFVFLVEKSIALWNTASNLIVNILDYNKTYSKQTDESWFDYQMKTYSLILDNYGNNFKNTVRKFKGKNLRDKEWI